MAEGFFDFFGFHERCAQADSNIVGEVVSAYGNNAAVRGHAFVVDEQVSGTGADVGEADAQFFFVGTQSAVGGNQGFIDGVVHVNAGAVGNGDRVLNGAGGASHKMQVDFQPAAHHAGWITHAGLIVEDELLRQQMKNLAVRRQA